MGANSCRIVIAWSLVFFTLNSMAWAESAVKINGRIQADAALYDEDVTELGSGTEFRRLRLAASGGLADGITYKAELDFADNSLDIKDAYVGFKTNLGSVKVGQLKMPFSLEELTSSRFITFMERALPNTFVTGRRLGVGLERTQGMALFGAAVYGQNADADSNDDEGIGIGGRVAFTPVLEDDRVVHLGLAAAFEELSDTAGDVVRVRQRPESHITTRLVDTGGSLTGVSDSTKLGLEAATVFGPLSFQGEYMRQSFDTTAGDADLDGYYVYASWFPGGQMRPYLNGKFDRVQASNAWELALRFSHLDLDDPLAGGGSEDNITLAANYYVNPKLRFMANYILADVDNGVNGDESPDVLQFRISMDF